MHTSKSYHVQAEGITSHIITLSFRHNSHVLDDHTCLLNEWSLNGLSMTLLFQRSVNVL